MVRTYTVFYRKTIYGEIDVESLSPTKARSMVENGDVDFGRAREHDEPIDVYAVE